MITVLALTIFTLILYALLMPRMQPQGVISVAFDDDAYDHAVAEYQRRYDAAYAVFAVNYASALASYQVASEAEIAATSHDPETGDV